MNISIASLAYNAHGRGSQHASGPDALLAADLPEKLSANGHIVSVREVELSAEEMAQYGGWNRVGIAGGHLAELVTEAKGRRHFVLGLLADCNGMLGMVGGLQAGKATHMPKRVGLVWIDAHADYNTPETSPSGMLGGMPVAVACGKALSRLRLQSKIRYPLQSPDVLMVGMRDIDDLESRALEDDLLTVFTQRDLVEWSAALQHAMEYLCEREDVVYVHVDLDILDPTLAPAAGLPSAGGLSGRELGHALSRFLAFDKVGALGVAAYRADADNDGRTRQQVLDALMGAFGIRETSEIIC